WPAMRPCPRRCCSTASKTSTRIGRRCSSAPPAPLPRWPPPCCGPGASSRSPTCWAASAPRPQPGYQSPTRRTDSPVLALAVAALGLLIGLSLGAVGAGGSVLAVPALVYVAGESARQATTTSLLVVGVAALVGLAVHYRAGGVRVGTGLAFGL